ncbi:hypothetical protein [Streptomyces sp. I05A-00742]|uniref:hypothetical protein n=1 Tax=Streptomyces sp. I05A-00742 TaxID=2732853 RepID=UPI001489C165|nr:hypothetical protein [Streptomyces sp. I05A-00742]
MNYLRGFIAWIAFAIVSSYDWRWGAAAALAVAVGLLVQDLRSGATADSLILEQSSVLFFAVLTVLGFSCPDSALGTYSGVLSLGWLALTAWGTVVVGRPFTSGIAKRHAPQAVWGTAFFRRMNVVITSVWAAAFTLSAVALAAVRAEGLGSGVSIPVQIAGFVVPAMFTARYRESVRARRVAQ